MSLIDGLLLAAIVALGLWAVVAPDLARRWRTLAALGVALGAAAQAVVEGLYWQFLPAYALLLVAALPATGGRLARFVGRAVAAALVAAALGPWALLPVPVLPKPDGPYAVGSETFRWVDASRPETATADPLDRRNVVAQAWYPIAPGTPGPHAVYMDGLGQLPPSVAGLPRFILRHYDRIDTRAVVDAVPSGDRAKWPVVLFSPGYGAPRAAYAGLASALASRGYVVLAVDHPYEAAVTQLADGRVVGMTEHYSDAMAYMAGQQSLRAADLGFVADQLGRPDAMGSRLAGRLDLDRIAAIGHSLGGATAAEAMDIDPRIKAAANIDGTLYGPVVDHRLRGPFLLLESDLAGTAHSPQNRIDNGRLLRGVTGPAWRYEIKRANHFSFTDAPMFFSPPGRWALSLLVGGGRGPVETQRATADILDAFLDGPLTGKPGDVAQAAGRYKDILGGSVR